MQVVVQEGSGFQLALVPEAYAEGFVRNVISVYESVATKMEWSEKMRGLVDNGWIPNADRFLVHCTYFYLVGVLSKELDNVHALADLLVATPDIMHGSATMQQLLQEYSGPPYHHYRELFYFDVVHVLMQYQLSFEMNHHEPGTHWRYTEPPWSRSVHNYPIVEVW